MHIFGIRHHGPGCARSLRAALEALEPDIVLVEGPPDAQAVLPLLIQEEMQPPVALLIYAQDKPKQAVYYPFTHFSPEWQALSYALQRGIPARFMDLPQAIQLANVPAEAEPQLKQTGPAQTTPVNQATHRVGGPLVGLSLPGSEAHKGSSYAGLRESSELPAGS